MSDEDRLQWDARHEEAATVPGEEGPPQVFAAVGHMFPTEGLALEIACGRGQVAVWLARRGMEVRGVDVSPVAIDRARDLAERSAVADRCHFEVHDLDDGLPDGPQVDLVLCHLFRDPRLDRPIIERVRSGGLVAVAVLSEVGATRGRFRARRGELREAFRALDMLGEGEGHGTAWLLGQRRDRAAGETRL